MSVDVKDIIKNMSAKKNIKEYVKVPTGVLGVDLILYGGFSYGGIHELYGLSKTGKTLLGLSIIKQAQTLDKNTVGVILDGENAHKNIKRIESLGVDTERLIIVPKKVIPTVNDCYEKILEILLKIEASFRSVEEKKEIKPKDVSLGIGRKINKKSPNIVFFIDSVPSFPEKTDLVEDMGKRAKSWHSILRRLTGILDEKTMLILSNHIIYKPDAYGKPESKTSGIAIDYYRDAGVCLTNVGTIIGKESKNVIGYWIEAEAEKTRDGILHLKTIFPLFFRKQPIHKYAGILFLAYNLNLIKINNESTWSKRKKISDVFPNFSYNSKVYNELDYKPIEDLVEKGDIVKKIKEKLLFY